VHISTYDPTAQASRQHPGNSIYTYTDFSNDSVNDIPDGKTSVELVPSKALHFAFTLFSPNDSGDARLRIKNTVSGKQCDTENYLINHVYVSEDQKTVLIYDYSGSNQYIDAVDIATCKSTAPQVVINPAATSITCPTDVSRGVLTQFDLYDGFPSENAALVPEDGGWKKLERTDTSKNNYYLTCEYKDKKGYNSIGFELPLSFQNCLFTDTAAKVVCK
jgi:hypothetical protein